MRMIISVRLSNGTIMNVVGNFQNKDSALAMARQYSQSLLNTTEDYILSIEGIGPAKLNQIKTALRNVGF